MAYTTHKLSLVQQAGNSSYMPCASGCFMLLGLHFLPPVENNETTEATVNGAIRFEKSG